MHREFTRQDLIDFKPAHSTFVGIDSDGCVFDTMEIKQRTCFHNLIVSHWRLDSVDRYVRETAAFVSLYSKWRGENRFPALVRTFDLLRERPEILRFAVEVPRLPKLREFIRSGATLANASIRRAAEETGDPELASVLEWSDAVSAEIARVVKNVPPFAWARRSLEKIRARSDAVCVSQTPGEALAREWSEHGLTAYVAVLAGQEMGSKTDHLRLATRGRYEPLSVLMIGDARGDRQAARDNQALFFPINPAREEESWERFYTEAYDRFLARTYAGDYEEALVTAFEALLPETPPWRENPG